MSELHDDIRAFRHFLEAERGMAENTVLAYRPRPRPLRRLGRATAAWRDYLKPTVRELSRYLEHLHAGGARRRVVARHLVALENVLPLPADGGARADPSAVNCSLRRSLWERIPHVLSPAASRSCWPPRNPLDRFYLRDRRLLEDAVRDRQPGVRGGRPQREDLYLDSAFCKCVGKGSKQRIVPLGPPAVTALTAVPAGRSRIRAAGDGRTGSSSAAAARSCRARCFGCW